MTRTTGDQYTTMIIRYLIAGVLFSFVCISSLWLYSAERYAEKEELSLLRQDIRDMKIEFVAEMVRGFERVDKAIDRKKP